MVVSVEEKSNPMIRQVRTRKTREGSVRYLQITEKQFASMRLLVGTRKFNEKKVNASQLLLF